MKPQRAITPGNDKVRRPIHARVSQRESHASAPTANCNQLILSNLNLGDFF